MLLDVPPVTGISDPFPVRVSDVPPGGAVRVSVRATDAAGDLWSSTTEFTADGDGYVDTGSALPGAAEWSPANSLGPLWTLRPDHGSSGHVFALEPGGGIALDVRVRARGAALGAGASRTVGRRAREVDDLPVPGAPGARLFVPADGVARPGVVLLGGAEGGVPAAAAAELADQGWSALALDWFPGGSRGVDVGEIRRALLSFVRHPSVSGDRLALIGRGRGAELALILAVAEPDLVGPVTAHSPSDIRTTDPHADPTATTYLGDAGPARDLPAPEKDSALGRLRARFRPAVSRGPLELADYYARARRRAGEEAVAAARIPVERIRGPLLVSAGTDDAVWDSRTMAETLAHRAAETGIDAYGIVHQGAGHGVGWPFTPAGVPVPDTIAAYGGTVLLGGDRTSSGAAAVRSRDVVLEFLRETHGGGAR
ncbi:acyl-CoA thioester hydrolase/BAAT C-terminal domain-containing protein [Corynebacterium pygosceleis]|uniref:Acyl-CoA thioesterase/BAAT N-terminal domain-containing protein n=1 Tax=Corynebacterium pygosceleis TaxID=2800406 RepID=A0A9Q4C6B6_9CORY|nr:acyl-CoA thioester hydrolase/BAAT C-terminal domain-containing protein [Corynebacterium pygosceleis]MCK7636567.1 acyl-CoA thioesterase/BAAT N-terminal domain-containing protein [Corynebacterium pygosceleis]MCK7675141.1 acyl-CoA thioesterase/BAAT N-terminal domain-containing protein [Corynebacterium pygosceleis]MCL0120642.1 acyl-CoA thioesterase/BAAT N-terminal domain-containing protein [Corynebacterium pygosceleis]MCX7467320.1 acyl-CoA thioesterase/BAAT N-terminal domain-containing protein [